jgi:hypothetical protein
MRLLKLTLLFFAEALVAIVCFIVGGGRTVWVEFTRLDCYAVQVVDHGPTSPILAVGG